ncbi:hypothetical protein ScPMuIL_015594 [Solemya velum]
MATGSALVTGIGSGILPIPVPDDKIYVDYIFLNQTRFGFCMKSKILNFEPKCLKDYPGSDMVMFDSLTEEKDPRPEMWLVPATRGEPAVVNMRRPCLDILATVKDKQPWFGIEQEYFLEDNRGDLVGWLANHRNLKLRDFYGAVGMTPTAAIEREIAEVHSQACLHAGIKFAGINREDSPGQWEYQIGPTEGIAAADDLVMSRVLLDRVAEMYGYNVNYLPKPVEYCLPGSGVHINFSTEEMRQEGGIKYIRAAMERVASVDQDKLLECYDVKWGEENKKRLTGQYYVPDVSNFRMGVADKWASLRIPPLVAERNCGYFEERRPSSNCDIYTAIAAFTKAAMFGENYICPR